MRTAASAFTIGCSSLLLFLVQPIMAKTLLPRFGGTAGVWIACMLFFQVVLLCGYLYSYIVTRHLSHNAQTLIHLALLAASLLVLPLRVRLDSPSSTPIVSILLLLTMSVGLPYFVLSSTSPLLQAWSLPGSLPYRLFALSNAASLVALLAYPVAVEPALAIARQFHWWSAGYWIFAAALVLTTLTRPALKRVAEPHSGTPVLWISLAACTSAMWLAVANHLSQEVAPIPFLWILPLSIYLLTFILCFEGHGLYRPLLFRWLLPAAWFAIVLAVQGSLGGLQIEIPVLAAALFICCMFCHGELADTKPMAGEGLPFFYVMVALGGAMGGVFVAVIAPAIFSSYLELPVAVVASILLALNRLFGYTNPQRLARVGLVAVLGFVAATRYSAGFQSAIHMRNFYGAIQIRDSGADDNATRALYNGRTLHGVQFISPARSRIATAFYGPDSGVAVALRPRTGPRKIGIIGLGSGALATYGRPGDEFRFYEINPAVVDVASRYFTFIAESEAHTQVITGDGRLLLEREPSHVFDILVLDAFADDSIPVHLLTLEAFQLYFDRLRPGGTLVVHITNRYLDLYPVVQAAAAAMHKKIVLIHNDQDQSRQIRSADWVLLSDGDAPQVNGRPWTDESSNLFRALR